MNHSRNKTLTFNQTQAREDELAITQHLHNPNRKILNLFSKRSKNILPIEK